MHVDAMTIVAALGLLIWLYLLIGHGGFWLTPKFDDLAPQPASISWPAIVAVVPARDEAENVGDSVRSILTQPYPGELSMILIDDQSRDGTARIAIEAAASIEASQRLTVISGTQLPPGWTGKLWAVKQGLDRIAARPDAPVFVLLTDADIVYSGDVVMRLVARAQADELAMASVMATLRCESFAERFLIPAFIFFFEMLYPFAWVRDPGNSAGAAAGGCILARWCALQNAGGIDSIRGALIDDCALGSRLKMHGPVWLGFSPHVKSARVSNDMRDIGHMVSRTAYAQLRYSPLLLAGTIIGMFLMYLAPVGLILAGHGTAQIISMISLASMALAFQPTLRYYDRSTLWGLALPAIALVYMIFTLNSAYQYYRGRGGMWKGRAQADVSRAP